MEFDEHDFTLYIRVTNEYGRIFKYDVLDVIQSVNESILDIFIRRSAHVELRMCSKLNLVESEINLEFYDYNVMEFLEILRIKRYISQISVSHSTVFTTLSIDLIRIAYSLCLYLEYMIKSVYSAYVSGKFDMDAQTYIDTFYEEDRMLMLQIYNEFKGALNNICLNIKIF
jgi:hypothetical protein